MLGLNQVFGRYTNRPQLGAQAIDGNLNRAISRRTTLAVERSRERRPAVNLPWVHDEMLQQATFRGRQPRASAVDLTRRFCCR